MLQQHFVRQLLDTILLRLIQHQVDSFLRAIKQARAATVTVLGLADVGLDAGAVAGAAGSRMVGLMPRPRDRGATLIDGGPAEIAARIAEIVGGAMRA